MAAPTERPTGYEQDQPPLAKTGDSGSVPQPDPTSLTTSALYREVSSLRDLVEQAIDSLKENTQEKLETVTQRIDGIDQATTLRLQTIDGIPDRIDEKVSHLKELHDEKFDSIATQFKERDTRSERESRDNKVAVDAAFAAQKEAAAKQEETFSKGIDKSEAATTETINKQGQLLKSTTDALDSKVVDLKERLGTLERDLRQAIGEVAATVNGSARQSAGAHQGGIDARALVFSMLGAVGLIAGIVIAVVKG